MDEFVLSQDQKILMFNKKLYKFIESKLGACCSNCSIYNFRNVLGCPCCMSHQRRDSLEGYWKSTEDVEGIKAKGLKEVSEDEKFLIGIML